MSGHGSQGAGVGSAVGIMAGREEARKEGRKEKVCALRMEARSHQNTTLEAAPRRAVLLLQGRSRRRLEHLPDALLGLGRTLQVVVGADARRHRAAVLRADGLELQAAQLVLDVLVVAQVLLVGHQDDGHVGAKVLDFGHPLLGDVLQRVRAVHRETYEDDVGVRVGERPQPVVVLLAGGVPQRELDLLVVHLDVRHVRLEHGGHVHLGELVLAEQDEQTRLAARAVSHHHELLADVRHSRVPARARAARPTAATEAIGSRCRTLKSSES